MPVEATISICEKALINNSPIVAHSEAEKNVKYTSAKKDISRFKSLDYINLLQVAKHWINKYKNNQFKALL